MKFFRMIALAALVGVLGTLPAVAQTTVPTTTNSVAISATTNQVSLVSVSGVVAGTGLYLDKEAMSVISVTGLVVRVIRGVDGTAVAAHAISTTVYEGPAPSNNVQGQGPFWSSDPPQPVCVAASEQYSLRINVTAGRIWKCVNATWGLINNPFPLHVDTHLAKGTVIASATTIAPTSYMTHVSGTTEITTITVPAGCAQTCTIVLIPDGAFTLATGGNIAEASTADANQALFMVWDGAAWYPSY